MTIDQLLNELWWQKTPLAALAYDAIINILGKEHSDLLIADFKFCLKNLLSFVAAGQVYDDLQSIIVLLDETDWSTR
jgi:hypothetical protein